MSETSVRTPREVMRGHGKALMKGDLDDLVTHYAADAILVTPAGAHLGHDGVREAQTQILKDVTGVEFSFKTRIAEGNVVFVEWDARGEDVVLENGVDTIVIEDGAIIAQTIRYTVRHTA